MTMKSSLVYTYHKVSVKRLVLYCVVREFRCCREELLGFKMLFIGETSMKPDQTSNGDQ